MQALTSHAVRCAAVSWLGAKKVRSMDTSSGCAVNHSTEETCSSVSFNPPLLDAWSLNRLMYSTAVGIPPSVAHPRRGSYLRPPSLRKIEYCIKFMLAIRTPACFAACKDCSHFPPDLIFVERPLLRLEFELVPRKRLISWPIYFVFLSVNLRLLEPWTIETLIVDSLCPPPRVGQIWAPLSLFTSKL